MAIRFEIKNLQQALNGINNYSNKVAEEINQEIQATGEEIVLDAKALAPVDDGNLRASIRVVRKLDYSIEIEAGAEYAAYVEFGTGGFVNVPPGLESYAIQFKGKGIRQVNLPARPYFFPAFMSNTAEMVKRFKSILENTHA